MVQEHEFDLSEKALNQFISDLDDTLNNATENVKQFFEEFVANLRENLDMAKDANVNSTLQAIADVIMGSGYRNTDARRDYNLIPESRTNTVTIEKADINSEDAQYVPVSSDEFVASISQTDRQIETDIVPKLNSAEEYYSHLYQGLLTSNQTLKDIYDVLKDNDNKTDISLTFADQWTFNGNGSQLTTKDVMNQFYPEFRRRFINELNNAGFHIIY